MLPRSITFTFRLAAVLALAACAGSDPNDPLNLLGTCRRPDGGPFTLPNQTQFTQDDCITECGPDCTWSASTD